MGDLRWRGEGDACFLICVVIVQVPSLVIKLYMYIYSLYKFVLYFTINKSPKEKEKKGQKGILNIENTMNKGKVPGVWELQGDLCI